MNSNPEINNLPDEIKSQLIKLPFKERMRLCRVIDSNVGKYARIIVRPRKPTTEIVLLSAEEKNLVNVGWIHSIELVTEQNKVVCHNNRFYLESDLIKINNGLKKYGLKIHKKRGTIFLDILNIINYPFKLIKNLFRKK